MNELVNKMNILIKEIDKLENVSKIKELNIKIKEDKNLNELITKYKKTQDEKIKKEIINNKLFKEYKLNETEINIIIMSINKELKKINNKGKCC